MARIWRKINSDLSSKPRQKEPRLLTWPAAINVYAAIDFKVTVQEGTRVSTCSFTLKEEGRLRVFENRVLRRILGSKWDDVTGERRKVYIVGLNDV